MICTDEEPPFTLDDDDVDSGREDNLDDEGVCFLAGGAASLLHLLLEHTSCFEHVRMRSTEKKGMLRKRGW